MSEQALESQRMGALRKANEVRLGKLLLKKGLRRLAFPEGMCALADLIEGADAESGAAGALSVVEALTAPRGAGETTAALVLGSIAPARRPSQHRKLRALSDGQRRVLASACRERAAAYRGSRHRKRPA